MKQKSKKILAGTAAALVVVALVIILVSIQNGSKNKYNDVIVSESSTDSTTSVESLPIDEEVFVKRAYELKYLFSVNKFSDAKEISVNKLVQYAICHLYYDSLLNMPKSDKLQYRSASKNDINNIIKIHFGMEIPNLEKSDLYNQSTKMFEIWLPKYMNEVYYTYATKEQGDKYIISASYYGDEIQSEKKGNVQITVACTDGKYYIESMK